MTPEQGQLLYKVFADTMKMETQITQKVIRAIPNDKKGYKPDPKSRSAEELAWHVVTSEVWFLDLILAGKAEMPQEVPPPPTIDGILEWYGTNYGDRVNRLEKLDANQLVASVSLFGFIELPAVSFLNMMNLHSAHHRGQLATYLRPMGSKVPDIYGGSADEPFQG